MKTPVVVDFETFPIGRRPDYPPKPVGVAIQWPGKIPRYYAWGHPTQNNASYERAATALRKAWTYAGGVACHNAKFDLAVAAQWFQLGYPKQLHDTMLLLFLDDPHRLHLDLKTAGAELLGEPPAARDAVIEWLVEHQPVEGAKLSTAQKSPNYAGKYIAYAPGNLVGTYANQDVHLTGGLWARLYPTIIARGMREAYQRELELLPCLLDMEQAGVPVALEQLGADVTLYEAALTKLDRWLAEKLGTDQLNLNLNSGAQLMPRLVELGLADETKIPRTITGKLSSTQTTFAVAVEPQVAAVLTYRSQLSTCLQTFMVPWLAVALRCKGLIYTQWHQTRGDDGYGARTGRLSSTPNFQNIPTNFGPLAPVLQRLDVPPLPNLRAYIIPFKGHVIIDRDYSQQEPRIFAHFDGHRLLQQYQAKPWTDLHDFAREELAAVGLHYERKPVKNTNLGLMYGMGVGKLAARNGTTVEEAAALKRAILRLYPGLQEMYVEMRRRARADEPIKTWGGREYYCEPPKIVNGRLREFDYKLVNVLIQGSAADCTKQAIVNFYAAKKLGWRLLLNVHDQLTVSVPKREIRKAMAVLKDCMEGVNFDVPMLTEGKMSGKSWGSLMDYDKKGVLVWTT